MSAALLCRSCTELDARWLDAITPGPHRPYPWEPQPVGRFRVQDAHNVHARVSVGAQLLRVVREQRRALRDGCARNHREVRERLASTGTTNQPQGEN